MSDSSSSLDPQSLPPASSAPKKGDRTLRKWLDILSTVTVVEPCALLMMMTVLISFVVLEVFLLENICKVHYHYSDDICQGIIQANQSMKREIDEVQSTLAHARIFGSIIMNGFPILYAIFMGPWSDHYGRKIPMLLPIVGLFFGQVMLFVYSFFIDSVNPYVLVITIALPHITGGQLAFGMAAQSYICDTTTNESRTTRIGLFYAGYLGGLPLGITLAGQMLKAGIKFHTIFAICAGIFALTFVWLLLFVKNTTMKDRLMLEKSQTEVKEEITPPEEGKVGCLEVLNPKSAAYEVLALPFKKREGYGRLKIGLLLLTYVCSIIPQHGEFPLLASYVRSKLAWDAIVYSYFQAYSTVIKALGVILAMGIMSHLLKLSDPLIGFLTCISQMGGSLLYAFSTTSFMMYLATTVDMMNGTMAVVARSMLSKSVEMVEIGKLFALITIVETIVPLFMTPVYNSIFMKALGKGGEGDEDSHYDVFYLGEIFVLSAALTIPALAVFFAFTTKVGLFRRKEEPKCEGKSEKELSKTEYIVLYGVDNVIKNETPGLEDVPNKTNENVTGTLADMVNETELHERRKPHIS